MVDGFLAWACIIPYTVFALLIALYNYRFGMQLPKPVRSKFFVAAGLYVFAAAGIESIEGYLMKVTAEDPVVLMVITTVQELLEMVAIVLLIAGILKYLVLTKNRFRLTFME